MRDQKGITLVALVVTIIVLLILAGVTIALVLGQDGIFGKAQTAVDKTFEADVLDAAKLAAMDYKVNSFDNDTSAFKPVTEPEAVKAIAGYLKANGYNVGEADTNGTPNPIVVTKGNNTMKVKVTISNGKVTVTKADE